MYLCIFSDHKNIRIVKLSNDLKVQANFFTNQLVVQKIMSIIHHQMVFRIQHIMRFHAIPCMEPYGSQQYFHVVYHRWNRIDPYRIMYGSAWKHDPKQAN